MSNLRWIAWLAAILLPINVALAKWASEEAALLWAESSPRVEVLSSGLLEESIEHAWWTLTRRLIQVAKDSRMDVSQRVKASVSQVQKQLTELVAELRKDSQELQRLSPAFQWTESPTHVYLQIKLAYRWTSPGSLSVENQNVTLEAQRVFFSGIGTHSDVKKLYILDIPLVNEIEPDQSDWTWGGVGKMTLTLKKKIPDLWFILTKQKIANMHTWFEMQARLEDAATKNTTTNKTVTTESDQEKKTEL